MRRLALRCAIYTHLRAADYSLQFGLAIGFLSLAVTALALDLAVSQVVVWAVTSAHHLDHMADHKHLEGDLRTTSWQAGWSTRRTHQQGRRVAT